MAASIRDIRRRIRSVESTEKLTRAMELVSSSKLRRARERAQEGRAYTALLRDTASMLSPFLPGPRREGERLFLVIAGDRGLAGGFNLNLFRAVQEAAGGKTARFFTIGKKAGERYPDGTFFGRLPELFSDRADEVSSRVLELWRAEEIAEITLCYTRFVNALHQQPVLEQLLPVVSGERKNGSMEFEPSPQAVFDAFLPLYLRGMIAGGAVESYAAEQAARRLAMETAGDNARELRERLSLSLNRARQSAITQELSEIVGGSGTDEL